MTKDSLKKKIKDEGVFGSLLYYLGRAASKTALQTVGKWTAAHREVQDRIVFKNREMQDFSDNARALFEYLIDHNYNEKYQIIWMVSDKKKFRNRKYKNVKFVTAENRHGWNSPLSYYYGATAKYFFYTNHTADLNRYHCSGQVTVNLWHGCGYKGSTLDKKDIPKSSTMGWFDYALVPGDLFVETKSAYWHCGKEKILPLGYPRYDWMLHPSGSREEILERLFGFKEHGTKAVIWMPTFRKSTQQGYGENEIELPFDLPALKSEEELHALDAYLKEKNILLIIKKHPLQVGWSEEREQYTNVRYVTQQMLDAAEIQLYALVGVCDGLLSDYSSIAVDYMLLDRPLGFVLTDMECYGEKRGFVFENPLAYMPGEKIYDFRELKAFFCHMAEGKDVFKEERKKLMPVMHRRQTCYCRAITEQFHIEK